MLSYQHSYHAGNFADVQKHAVLVGLMQAMALGPQKFCVMDTHAGRGLYDLAGPEARKIGEFRNGILPFWTAREEKTPLSDYLKIVSAFNDGDDLRRYPGSPAVIRHLMRPMDSLILIERHPAEFTELQNCFKGSKNVQLLKEDGFRHLTGKVPFAERRGLVLVDPSYEIKSEYDDLPRLLHQAWKKWPQGQFMIWYPMLDAGLHLRMLTALRKTNINNVLVSEILLEAPPRENFALTGSGIIIVNPPFGFETVLDELTQFISARLPVKASGDVFWLDNRRIDPETGMV
ncbi:MAG: 23S rRNA (adenine(2030)-N(6))-methyltransferase RlmJ [Pseudomonadota bacterium]